MRDDGLHKNIGMWTCNEQTKRGRPVQLLQVQLLQGLHIHHLTQHIHTKNQPPPTTMSPKQRTPLTTTLC